MPTAQNEITLRNAAQTGRRHTNKKSTATNDCCHDRLAKLRSCKQIILWRSERIKASKVVRKVRKTKAIKSLLAHNTHVSPELPLHPLIHHENSYFKAFQFSVFVLSWSVHRYINWDFHTLFHRLHREMSNVHADSKGKSASAMNNDSHLPGILTGLHSFPLCLRSNRGATSHDVQKGGLWRRRGSHQSSLHRWFTSGWCCATVAT